MIHGNRHITRLLCPLLIMLAAACSGGSGDNVVLNGDIQGLGSDTIFIYGADGLYNTVDTIVPRNGRFTKELQADTVLQVWMLFSDGHQYPLYINKRDHISIRGNINDLDHLQVSGTDDNELLSEFLADTTTARPIGQRVAEFVGGHPASKANIYLLQKFVAYADVPDEERIDSIIGLMDNSLHDWNAIRTIQDKNEDLQNVKVGVNAPFFRAETTKGYKTLNNYRDSCFLLMHFWASWNESSRDAARGYRQLYKDSKLKDLRILGISLDTDRQSWLQAVKADSTEWTQSCDGRGWDSNTVKQYATRHLPANFLISPDGKIIGVDLTDSQAVRDSLQAYKDRKKQ